MCAGDNTRKLCGTGFPPNRKFPEYEIFDNPWLISETAKRYLEKPSLVDKQALHVFAANEQSK